MGGGKSRPPSPPPATLSEPWREIQWGDKKSDLQYVWDYQPDNTELQHLRILLHGPVGAGKSSFINSVNNVLQGRMTNAALTDSALSDNSFTMKYNTYKIQKGNPRTFYPFVFNDIMGLEDQMGRGVHPEDVKLAMEGHVRDGYTFNPVSKMSTEQPRYNSSPTPNDKVHVLVCVVPVDKVSLWSKEVVQKMRDIRLAASEMGIPQLAVLTRIDVACPEIQKNIKNVYKSKYLKEKMEEFSALVGIPLNCIFPVKNYNSEIQIKDDIDSLILSALRRMIDFGEDFVNRMYTSWLFSGTAGGASKPSTPSPTSQPSPTLSEPWRKIQWGNKESDLQYMKDYQPDNTELQHLRILLHGPIGAGKSSFFNSVNSVLRGRMTNVAPTDSTSADSSFTKKYKTYKIKQGNPGTFYPFVFNDIMGLEDQTDRGVHPEDIKLAMEGHVRDGHKFNPVSKLSKGDPGYNSDPTLNDKVHVLVCVIPVDTVPRLSKDVVQKMRDIRLAASDMGIPQVAILTKIDEACPEIQKNIRDVYKSKHLKTKMEEFSKLVGIPMNCIFPVKNYHEESEIHDDVDSLILDALRKMIDFGEDFASSM